jgi:hypothetical protein
MNGKAALMLSLGSSFMLILFSVTSGPGSYSKKKRLTVYSGWFQHERYGTTTWPRVRSVLTTMVLSSIAKTAVASPADRIIRSVFIQPLETDQYRFGKKKL